MTKSITTLAELRAFAEPLALRLVDLQREHQRVQQQISDAIEEQRLNATAAIARGEPADPALPKYRAALHALALQTRGVFTAEQTSWRIAEQLGLRELHNSPAAMGLSPERRIELLLSQRFEAQTEGN